MESSVSEIIKTAIELDGLLIKKYLIEQQNKSSDSPAIFFGRLRSLVKNIKQEQPSAVKWFLVETSGGWFEEVGLINWSLSKQAAALGLSQEIFVEHLEELQRQFDLVDDIVNRLFEQSISTSESPPISDVGQPKKQNPLPPTLENSFNNMPIKEVRAIFMPLVETKNKNGEYWMTRKDFDVFIRRSFLKESLAKPKINFNETEKGCIIKLFYVFYTKSKEKREITSRLKKRYIELLEEAFNTDVFFNLNSANFCSRAKCDWLIN